MLVSPPRSSPPIPGIAALEPRTRSEEVATVLEEEDVRPGPLRWILVGVGWLTMGLAVLGVFLPLLPTTPFLLLAAACFLRSSPKLHRRMLADPRFGPYLEQWQRDRSIPAGAKRRAYLLVIVTFGISMAVVDDTRLRVSLGVLGAGVLALLIALRTAPEE